MTVPQFILEINTRVWLRTLGLGNSPSLRDIPDSILDEWQRRSYDAIWLMGVWLPSAAGEEIARTSPGLKVEFSRALHDWHEEDITASPYAIRGYEVNPEWGGDEALANLRMRLSARSIRLILDYVPNHVARDHPWIFDHPQRFMQGTSELMQRNPQNYFEAATSDGKKIIAHGRDPHFDGWSDTAQLDYRLEETHDAMRKELLRIARMCDGVRCDMAMLLLNDVFARTWEVRSSADTTSAASRNASLNVQQSSPPEFWPSAIRTVKDKYPEFCFIAEVYWGLESKLRDQGFDLCYDKSLLDDILHDRALTRERFDLPLGEHVSLLRFLENHDEPRIASRLDSRRLNAAAAWVLSLPGSRLIYEGQIEGKRVRIPVQLLREPKEEVSTFIRNCYERILAVVTRETARNGAWRLLVPRPAWMGSDSHTRILGQSYDLGSDHLRILVNWSDARSQCWVDILLSPLHGKQVILRDLWTGKVFIRDGIELMMRGFYLDMEPWEAHAFDCEVRDV